VSPGATEGVMDGGGAAAHVTCEVSGASVLAGVGVCAQESVATTGAEPGRQVRPIAGALAPSAAGPAIVRLAPLVIANADAPVAGMVQANPKLPPAVPSVASVIGIEPTPPFNVTGEVRALIVGATPTTGDTVELSV